MTIEESAREPIEGWALVTGASGRGGAAISRALHCRGMSIVIHHTPRSRGAALDLGGELEGIRLGSTRLWEADFADPQFEPAEWLAYQGVNLIVCNASAYQPSSISDRERAARDIGIHVAAHSRILAALDPAISPLPERNRLNSVVAITDIGVERPAKGYVFYTVAKGALQTLMLALATDWAPQVRCNVVQPGSLPFPVDWGDRDRAQRIEESIPMQRTGSFDDLAGAVLYLGLDATYVTGQVLAVDGGRSRHLE